MSIHYRTGKTWRDADMDGLLIDWRAENGTLTVMLDYAAVVAARKDDSIARGSQWRRDGTVYETVDAGVMPARGLMRVVAVALEGSE